MDNEAVVQLVERTRGGDAEAFTALVSALQRELRIFIAAHALDREQLEEIHQATWVTAFEKLSTYQPIAPFPHWLRGIARNLLRRDLEERARRRGGDADLLALAAVDEGLATLEREDDPRLARLGGCLERLAPRARELVLARHRDGVPLAKLAQRFKQPAAALATALWRVRGALQACVEKAETSAESP